MNARPSTLLEDGATLEQVGTGAVWAEGPTWVPERNAVRYSDVRSNRILEYSETTRELSVYGSDVEFTNGRALDPDGSVVQCSHGRRAIERDTNGTVETLVDRFGDVRFNSPNDVVVKSDGTIWFSDPSYGIDNPAEGHGGELEYGDRYVFRFDPASGELTAVITDIMAPNGLAFSPDESVLYVSDTAEEAVSPYGPAQSTGNPIRAYDVVGGRQAKNGRVFVRVAPGVPDGFRVDTDGNIWSSGGDGVRVFSPAGELLEFIPVPETVSNVCFGGQDGRTLYMTATSSLYRIRTTASDAAAALRANR
ncbi:SMP-30/gluconolactonase/LRE family protein [Arthrobacter yangruifuii]|uniref:SMP-30/gluconolactonase/LRE family protein n=1 Tax=Arthrobacter yangruifuii TaxID=2606616 RepID=UPI00164778C4|nr:SMP-30/gluconolactonase/LRE family protein [Arthrobacter yangruifuii]